MATFGPVATAGILAGVARVKVKPVKPTRPFKVYVRRRGGSTTGYVTVQATCASHAQRVGIRQLIEVSFPKTLPKNWIVTATEEVVYGG